MSLCKLIDVVKILLIVGDISAKHLRLSRIGALQLENFDDPIRVC